jgi:hypothetical protein
VATPVNAPPTPATPAVPPAGKPKPPFSVRFARWLIAFVVLMFGGFALYTWASLNFAYSEGERVGYIRKVSYRGWICKTWEAELSMTNSVGAQEAIFEFTVRDPKVVEQVKALEGKHVSVKYDERKGIPSSCFGDTPYHVYAIRPIK